MRSSQSKGAARRALPFWKSSEIPSKKVEVLPEKDHFTQTVIWGRNLFLLSQTSKLPNMVTSEMSLLLERSAGTKMSPPLQPNASLTSYKWFSSQPETTACHLSFH